MGMIEIPIKRREPVMRWIPCSERLPEEDGRYLVSYTSINGSYVDVVRFYKKPSKTWTLRFDKEGYNADLIAWMPLPEPISRAKGGQHEF